MFTAAVVSVLPKPATELARPLPATLKTVVPLFVRATISGRSGLARLSGSRTASFRRDSEVSIAAIVSGAFSCEQARNIVSDGNARISRAVGQPLCRAYGDTQTVGKFVCCIDIVFHPDRDRLLLVNKCSITRPNHVLLRARGQQRPSPQIIRCAGIPLPARRRPRARNQIARRKIVRGVRHLKRERVESDA